MKKVLLFAAAVLAAGTSFAQGVDKINGSFSENPKYLDVTEVSKTTKVGDTLVRINFSSTQLNNDSLASYLIGSAPFDSGYLFGMNPYGDQGFAERYTVGNKDSSARIIGVYGTFDGQFQNNTNKTVTFNVWRKGPRTRITDSVNRPKVFYSGKPTTSIASQQVSIRNLGINRTGNSDTTRLHTFTTPSPFVSDSFFVGYVPNWTWAQSNGDTIGLKTTRATYRYQAYSYTSGGDTIRNVVNAIQYSNGTWNDEFYQNSAIGLHFVIFPLFIVGPAGIADGGISNKGLTFFGNYPNPANASTKVKFSLKSKTDATITVTDVNGRTLQSIEKANLNVGDNEVEINTSALAPGNYFYLLRTGNGAGMGAQMTVVH